MNYGGCEADYAAYLDLVAQSCAQFFVQIWAWCLMPNHAHLIAVPSSAEALRQAIGRAHQRYTNRVNQPENWRGHLWQGRFGSFVLEEAHLWTPGRYVEMNPVRSRLVAHPADWPWSRKQRARALGTGRTCAAGQSSGAHRAIRRLERLSCSGAGVEELETFRRHIRTGRPLGDVDFLARLETLLSRPLRKRKSGPKPHGAPEGKVQGQMELWESQK